MDSSSSSSSFFSAVTPTTRAAPPDTAAAHGNARFMSAMQPAGPSARGGALTVSVPPCILVDGSTERRRREDTERHHLAPVGRDAAAHAQRCGDAAPRLRRVCSSSSSSYSTYSATYAAEASSHVASAASSTTASTSTTAGKATEAAHGSRATLSAEAFQQVLQELHHPRVRARPLTSNKESGAGAAPHEVLPGWWSRESSVLPAGSTAPSSSSISSSLSSRGVQAAAARQQRSKREGKAEVIEPSSSSCGCPTSCSCRTEDEEGSYPPPVPLSRWRQQSSRECGVSAQRVRRTCGDDSDDSSLTGATPMDTSNSSEEDAAAAAVASYDAAKGTLWHVASHHGHNTPHRCCSGSESSLCSSCVAAAKHHRHSIHPLRARASTSDDGDGAVFARRDVFADAVRGNTMWEEVPPLLYLSSSPAGGSRGEGRRRDDAEVLAQRHRDERRAEYIRQAALLAAGRYGEEDETPHAAPTNTETPLDQRRAAATQTEVDEKVSEEQRERERQEAEQQRLRETALAEERLRGLAAAQCAEVALPMLHRELESYETRVNTQQQQQMTALLQQLRDYQQEVQALQAGRVAELAAHRAQWEKDQQRVQEATEARQRASRRDCGIGEEQAVTKTEDAAAPAVAEAVTRYTAGTQHSDGTQERLASVEAEAHAWLLHQLCALEKDARARLAAEGQASRQLLVGVVEEASRRVLLRCQAEVLLWRQRALSERQAATHSADVRALQMQEVIARQELEAAAADQLRDVQMSFYTQRSSIEAAAAQSAAHVAQQAQEAAEEALATLQDEHKDTLEHVRHLRVQLLHALRMPTITLPSDSGTAACRPAPGAPLLSAAYAYATATGDELAAEGGSSGDGAVSAAAELRPVEDLPVHRRFARAHQEALRVVRAQCRTV